MARPARVWANIDMAQLNRPGHIIHEWTRRVSAEAEVAAKLEVQSTTGRKWGSTGQLGRSIKGDLTGSNKFGVNFRLSADAPYALYVHRGTRGWIHTPDYSVMPVGASQGAARAFAESVAGQRANPFLRNGLSVVLVRHRLRPILGIEGG